jgi:iron complex outermembrane receptor protein
MWQRGPWDAELSWIEVFKQARVGVNEAPVDGYTQLSAHLNYTTELESGELQWFVRGQNLLDEDIRLATSLLRNTAPEPGVNIETGIRFYF